MLGAPSGVPELAWHLSPNRSFAAARLGIFSRMLKRVVFCLVQSKRRDSGVRRRG